MPPSAVTVSRISIAPASRTAAAISSIGCHAPVDVSAITIATTFGFTRASASFTSASVNTSPHGRSIFVTSPPARSAMSASRPPNTPLTHTSTRSPGSTRFDDRRFLPGRARAADRHRHAILRAEHVAQHRLQLVHDLADSTDRDARPSAAPAPPARADECRSARGQAACEPEASPSAEWKSSCHVSKISLFRGMRFIGVGGFSFASALIFLNSGVRPMRHHSNIAASVVVSTTPADSIRRSAVS